MVRRSIWETGAAVRTSATPVPMLDGFQICFQCLYLANFYLANFWLADQDG
jgi:hypothetical protein